MGSSPQPVLTCEQQHWISITLLATLIFLFSCPPQNVLISCVTSNITTCCLQAIGCEPLCHNISFVLFPGILTPPIICPFWCPLLQCPLLLCYLVFLYLSNGPWSFPSCWFTQLHFSLDSIGVSSEMLSGRHALPKEKLPVLRGANGVLGPKMGPLMSKAQSG